MQRGCKAVVGGLWRPQVCAGAIRTGGANMRNLQRSLTYWLGYRRGKQGRPARCPWWANCLVYAIAHMYGHSAYVAEVAAKAADLGT